MSHVSYEEARRRERKSACRGGRHKFGKPRFIGAGITRQVCRKCGAVTIDLSGARDTSPFERQLERLLSRNPRRPS